MLFQKFLRREMLSHKLFGFWMLPVFIMVFIIPQSFFAAFRYGDELSFFILCIAALSIVSYLSGGGLALKLFKKRVLCLSGGRLFIFNFLLFLYFFSYVVMYLKYGGIPLLEIIFNGGNSSAMRADFYKNQEGIWKVFSYLLSILNKGFIPFAIIAIFLERSAFRFFLILSFISFLSISALEKALLVWTYIPLLFFAVFRHHKKLFFISFALLAFCFSVVSSLALESDLKLSRGQASSYHVEFKSLDSNKHILLKKNINYENKIPVSLKDESDYQFLLYDLSSGDPISYLINRLVWIPYVTVYDTLLYWNLQYDSYIFFSVNRYLADIFGVNFADLERQVFRFQYGSGEESTGNANAAYFSEAYIGFGLPGVILFSFFIGLMFGGTIKSDLAPFIYSLPVIALGLVNVSLISTLFSGGLMFFIVFVFLFSTKDKIRDDF